MNTMTSERKPYDSKADAEDHLRKAEKRIRVLEQSLVDAKLDRDRAVLEAREIIKNVKPLAVDQQDPDGYRKASEWMQRWFPH